MTCSVKSMYINLKEIGIDVVNVFKDFLDTRKLNLI